MTQKPFQDLAKALLDKQISLIERMLILLKSENDILHKKNVENLTEASEKKHPLMVDIDTLNQHWLALLELEIDKNKKIDAMGISRFLRKYDSRNKTLLSILWKKLLNSTKECQRLNTINGAIITLRNQAAQQTLSILRGHSEETLYDIQGVQSPTYVGGHTIAKA